MIKVEYPPQSTISLVGERIPIKGSPTQEYIVQEMKAVPAPATWSRIPSSSNPNRSGA